MMDNQLELTGVAAEIFAASWCNLDCTYCNIPKHNQMIKDQHKKIIEDIIKVTPIIDRLVKLYGDSLEIISHWGSEPTLTLGYFKAFYKEAVVKFPRLERISMSSNFMTSPTVISNFILNDIPKSKVMKIDVQMSIDGEAKVTEVNRGVGTTEIIQKNIISFVENMNRDESIYHNVEIHFKPTMSKEQYQDLLNGDNMRDHYQFFDNLMGRIKAANKYNNVVIVGSCDPTVVCPDKYTKKDGEVLSEFYIKVEALAKEKLFKHLTPSFSSYYGGFTRLIDFNDELFTKSRMFTCSAGDSQFGVSEYIHPCHDTFYLPYDEVQDAIRDDMGRINSNREAENADSGRIELAKKVLTKKLDSMTQLDVNKYQYHMRAFHDFTKFRLSFSVAVVMLMAKCGQVSECYKDPKMATLLGLFATVRHSCPTGNQAYTGSVHLTDMAYFRLFGNGLVESFLKKAITNEL